MYNSKNSLKTFYHKDHRPLGLYIHFPYCSQRCPYCDFTLTTTAIPHENYLQASMIELELRLHELESRSWSKRPLSSIYFGGGTPGLWHPKCLKSLLDKCRQSFPFKDGIEITIEANPAEITLPLLRTWSDYGINRLSLGVQSMRTNTLKRLGRNHTPEQVEQVVSWLKFTDIRQFSVDLIHGLAGEGVKEALEDLEAVLKLSPQHISLYQLTIEEKTSFGLRANRGETLLEPDEKLIQIYRALSERLEQSGMSLYEVSNAASPEHEAKHNSLYWTMGDYIGIGTGAHGRVIIDEPNQSKSYGLRWQNIRSPQKYIEKCLDESFSIKDKSTESIGIEEERGHIDQEGLNEEAILVGLRLKKGLVLTEEILNQYGRHAQALIHEGLLIQSAVNSDEPWGRWQATERGRELLDHLCFRLILG